MSEKPSQSPEAVELKLPDEVKKLTPEQQNELHEVWQRAALLKEESERVALLKTEVSESTKKALEGLKIEISELAQEKGSLEKIGDAISSGVETLTDAFKNPGEALDTAVNKVKPDSVESAEKWFERMKNGFSTVFSADFVKEFFSKLFTGEFGAIRQMFSDAFGFSDTMSFLRENAVNILQNFSDTFSAVKISALNDVFSLPNIKDITLEKLKGAIGKEDLPKVSGLDTTHNNIKTFLQIFFEENAFAKMSAAYKNKNNGQEVDPKTVTVGNFLEMIK